MEVLELKARIKTLEADLARESSLLAVLEMEDARLAKNDVIAGDQGWHWNNCAASTITCKADRKHSP